MAAQSRGGRPAAKRTPAKAAQPTVTPKVEETVVENVPAETAPTTTEIVLGSTEVGNTTPVETAEQKRIRELEEQVQQLLALQQKTSEDTVAEDTVVEEKSDKAEKILIHFVEDGWTAQGQVWYRGQELEFVVGDKAWKDTLDRNGDSWVLISENDQSDRFGNVYFRRGPWPGKPSYKDGEWEKDAPSESILTEADIKERERRRRGAPTLPSDLEKI